MKRITKKFKYGSLSILMLSLTTIYGFNCSRSFVVEDASLDSHPVTSASLKCEPGVSLLPTENIVKTFVSLAGVETIANTSNELDAEIMAVYGERSGSLPSSRDFEGITGPMMVATTNIAAAVCKKLIVLEATERPIGSRRFFDGVDFTARSTSVSRGTFDQVTAQMARVFWSRDISQEEQEVLASELLGGFSAGLTSTQMGAMNPTYTSLNNETFNLGVSICTTMLSSLDALLLK